MKKLLPIAGGVVAACAVLVYIYQEDLSSWSTENYLKPRHNFTDKPIPAAPDYSQASSWAALPDTKDGADISPEPEKINLDRQDAANVDVFFIHPTTYYKPDSWNQPLDHQEANSFTDGTVLPNQASVFNSCCRVYAPRYRQATLYSFYDDNENSRAALDLAYDDVKNAFEYFITNYSKQRPFIVAGHSQGSKHLDRLLKEEINNTELQGRMIAAYPVGFPLDGSNGIEVCSSAKQTGCQVTWNAVAPDYQVHYDPASNICVNPLTWKTDGEYAGVDKNLGSVNFSDKGDLQVGVIDAQCKNGLLIVKNLQSDQYPDSLLGKGNYHIYDYGFYHMNIRSNVQQRVSAYQARSGGEKPTPD